MTSDWFVMPVQIIDKRVGLFQRQWDNSHQYAFLLNFRRSRVVLHG
jgi:hypothetical protein